MEIRNATEKDLPEMMKIYDGARTYMVEHGNLNQWTDGYPSKEVLLGDIKSKTCYVLEENDRIEGVFVLVIGEEPTYKVIENGSWNFHQTYGTIHRIASAGNKKGIAKACFDYCTKRVNYLRIDTHKDNKTMQKAILQYGFSYCGIIYVRNGKREAFDYLVEN